jgi:hypothetical protein
MTEAFAADKLQLPPKFLCLMSWFATGVSINCITIVLLIINAVYDALSVSYASRNNTWPNLIGVVLALVVIMAFSLKNSGKLSTANIVLWISAGPLSILLGFTALYLLIIFVTKPDWR